MLCMLMGNRELPNFIFCINNDFLKPLSNLKSLGCYAISKYLVLSNITKSINYCLL